MADDINQQELDKNGEFDIDMPPNDNEDINEEQEAELLGNIGQERFQEDQKELVKVYQQREAEVQQVVQMAQMVEDGNHQMDQGNGERMEEERMKVEEKENEKLQRQLKAAKQKIAEQTKQIEMMQKERERMEKELDQHKRDGEKAEGIAKIEHNSYLQTRKVMEAEPRETIKKGQGTVEKSRIGEQFEKVEKPRLYYEETEDMTMTPHRTQNTSRNSGEYLPPMLYSTPRNQNTSEVSQRDLWDLENRLGYMFMMSGIPDPLIFTGEDKEVSMALFESSFNLKYGTVVEEKRVELLARFMKGKALKVYSGLPPKERKTVKETLKAIAGRLRKSVEDETRSAKKKFEELKIKDEQTMEDFCLLVDEIGEKALYRSPPIEIASHKTQKILSALETRNPTIKGILQLRLLEEEEEDHYDICRKYATVIEEQEIEAREEKKGKAEQKQSASNKQKKEPNVNGVGNQGDNKPNTKSGPFPSCFECKEIGCHAPDCSKAPSVTCFNCGLRGHYSTKCPSPKRDREQEQKERVGVNSVEVTESLNTVEEVKDVTGPRKVEKGKLGVADVEILVDSGASVSIISEKTWKRIVEENEEGWEQGIERMVPIEKEVFVANNKPMRLLAQVKVETSLGNKTREIVYQIAESGRNTVILGTNGFKEMGISMSIEEVPRSVKTMERVRIMPNESRLVRAFVEGVERNRHCLVLPVTDVVQSTICQVDHKGETLLQISNFTNKPVIIRKGDKIATAEFDGYEILEDQAQIDEVFMRGMWKDSQSAEEKERPLNASSNESTLENVCTIEGEETGVSRNQMLWAQLEQDAKISDDRVRKLINDFRDTFAVDDKELTRTNVKEGDIQLIEGALPIRQKPRPIPLAVRPEIRKMIQSMVDRKVIRESTSPWASPVVLVKKKDGSIRMCIDYRKLNKVVRNNAHPLPHIETTLQSLQGMKVFTTFDLLSGYWQIPLKEECKEITAFAIGKDLFEFNVLPFGLVTSPAIFQSTMESILGDMLGDFVHIYVDDVLIASKTLDEHVVHVRKVLERMRQYGLKLKAAKCHIARSEVDYLGHKISAIGVETEEKKIEKMKGFQRPTNAVELLSFLGLVGYYRKFILNFAQLAAPLTPLTSSKREWKWEEDQETAFQSLLDAICRTPVLAQPDVQGACDGTRPFLIYTDASKLGIGAVLAQEDENGDQHPIAFTSKALSPAEKRYHVTDLEGLAMMNALKRFKTFIYGTQVMVFTDHKPLVALLRGSPLADRLLRWSIEILEFNVKIVYIAGKANVVADALSRGGSPKVEKEEEETNELGRVINQIEVKEEEEEVLNKDRWYDWLKEEDEGWKEVIEKLERGDRTGEVKVLGLKEMVTLENYELVGGTLRNVEDQDKSRRVVPIKARETLVREMHQGMLAGHFGTEKMFRQLKQRYFWPKMRVSCEKEVKACVKCLCTNDRPKLTAPLKPYETSFPLEIVACDLIDVGLSVHGNRYILTIIDLFTKYGSAVAIGDKKAETVARAFMERWAMGEGRIPHTLLTDQGKEFANSHFEKITKMLQIRHVMTKGYNSRAAGAIERFNKTLMHTMKKKNSVPMEWDEQVQFAVFAYNTIAHNTTGESPMFLMYGRDSGNPLFLEEEDAVGMKYVDVDEYKHLLTQELKKVHEVVTEKAREEGGMYKKLFDEKHHTAKRRFPTVGSRVLVEIPAEKLGAKCPKLVNKWKGPYRVVEHSENSATVVPVLGKTHEKLVIPFDNLRVIPKEMDDSPVVTVKGRGIAKGLAADEICIQNETHHDSHFSREILRCACATPCVFHVPGIPETMTTSPTQLLRMMRMIGGAPELKKDPTAILILAKKVWDWGMAPDSAFWEATQHCTSILAVVATIPHWKFAYDQEFTKLAEKYNGAKLWEASQRSVIYMAPGVQREAVSTLDMLILPRHGEDSDQNLQRELKEARCTLLVVVVPMSGTEEDQQTWTHIIETIPSRIDVMIVPAYQKILNFKEVPRYNTLMETLKRRQGKLYCILPETRVERHQHRTLMDISLTCSQGEYWRLVRELAKTEGIDWTTLKLRDKVRTAADVQVESTERHNRPSSSTPRTDRVEYEYDDRRGQVRGRYSGYGGRGGYGRGRGLKRTRID